MSTNDLFLLDCIIDKKIQDLNTRPTDQAKGEVFEKMALAELLKSYDLSEEALAGGITDGTNDGGIDAFYTFANGNLCSDKNETFNGDSLSLVTYLITSKHDDTFIMHPLESMHSSIHNLLDFQKKKEDLITLYNERVIDKALLYRSILKNNYLSVKSNVFKICYVSRGDAKTIADGVTLKIKEVCDIIQQDITDAKAEPVFWGAKELLLSTRVERNGMVNLHCERNLTYEKDYVVLVKLTDYFKFVTDESGAIKKYFFDENVRDYLGSNSTNKDIMGTLKDERDTIDFWNLNNGITILAKEFKLLDKTGFLTGVQIVNGLQTTMSIYNYFTSNPDKTDDRMVLIKIIAEKNEEERKRIIRATNNQSKIALYSLHANDKIQKDIEDALLAESLYYERKTKFYQNKGISQKEIITPLLLARLYVSVFLKNPCSASKLKQDFMDNAAKYNLVFNTSVSIKIWPKLSKLVLRVVECINFNSESKKAHPTNINKIILSYLCFFCVSATLKRFSYTDKDILNLDVNSIDEAMVLRQMRMIKNYVDGRKMKIKRLTDTDHGNRLICELIKQENISDCFVLKKNKILDDDYEITKETVKQIHSKLHEYQESGIELNECLSLLEKEYGLDKKIIRTVLFG